MSDLSQTRKKSRLELSVGWSVTIKLLHVLSKYTLSYLVGMDTDPVYFKQDINQPADYVQITSFMSINALVSSLKHTCYPHALTECVLLSSGVM